MKTILLPLCIAVALAGCGRAPQAAPAVERTSIAVAKGVVEVPGGLMRLVTPRDGALVIVSADEGAHVSAGQVMAQLDDRQARLQLASAEADLGQRRAELAVAQARAGAASRESKRLATLAAGDAATRQEADQASSAAVVADGEQREAAQAVQAAETRRMLAAFEVDARTIRAPAAGRILRRQAAVGDYVAANSPLFVVAPDGPRVVRAELDEAFADRVAEDSRALVSREFQSEGAYSARVIRVADALSPPSVGEDAASRVDARVVDVILALAPGSNLRLGQRVLVRFER